MKKLQRMLELAESSLEFEIDSAKLEFTEQMLELMEARGMSRKDLAEALSVGPSFVTKLLAGQNNFTFETAIKICRVLGARFQPNVESDLAPYSEKWQCAVKGSHFYSYLEGFPSAADSSGAELALTQVIGRDRGSSVDLSQVSNDRYKGALGIA